jgi:hypothetical protein
MTGSQPEETQRDLRLGIDAQKSKQQNSFRLFVNDLLLTSNHE